MTPELSAATKALYASARLVAVAFERNGLDADDGSMDTAGALLIQDAIEYDSAYAEANATPRRIRTTS